MEASQSSEDRNRDTAWQLANLVSLLVDRGILTEEDVDRILAKVAEPEEGP